MLRLLLITCFVLNLIFMHTNPVLSGVLDSTDAHQTYATIAAEKYAPILWFGSGERYFPTIPFFTAFQWKNRADPDSDYCHLLSENCSTGMGAMAS